MAAARVVTAQSAAMAGEKLSVTALAVVLLFAGAVLAADFRPGLVGAPMDVSDASNDSGLQRALKFAMEEYNKASNDMYSSRVVRVISAKKQVVAGVNYIMEVEIARTVCPKPAGDLQTCAFHDEPHMAKHTFCKFVVYDVPWLKKTELKESRCH